MGQPYAVNHRQPVDERGQPDRSGRRPASVGRQSTGASQAAPAMPAIQGRPAAGITQAARRWSPQERNGARCHDDASTLGKFAVRALSEGGGRFVVIAHFTSSIRCKATSDQFEVSSSTRIAFTGVPLWSSRLQQRWARLIRYNHRTHANDRREEMNFLLGVLLLQTVHQMQLGADRPASAGRRLLNRLNDLGGRAGDVGDVVHFLRAFGMHKDLDAGILRPKLGDMLGAKHLVDAAMAFPEDHAAVANRLLGVAAQVRVVRNPRPASLRQGCPF